MSTHIEDLEREEYEAKQREYEAKLTYNRSIKKTIAETKEIWGELSDWLSDMTDHINSLRSTEWIPHTIRTHSVNHRASFQPCIVQDDEHSANHYDVGLQWAYFAHNSILYTNGGRNGVTDRLNGDSIKRLPFLPFLNETLTFEIKTTNSALKRGEFDRFIENPPKGYSVMGSESYELFQEKGHKLVIQLVLDKKYDFKTWHYQKYSILKTLKYFENQISKFRKWNDFYLVQCSSDLLNLSNGSTKTRFRSPTTKKLLQHLEWLNSNVGYLDEVGRVLDIFKNHLRKVRQDARGKLIVDGDLDQSYNPILHWSNLIGRLKRDKDLADKIYWSEDYSEKHQRWYGRLDHCDLVPMRFDSVCSLKLKTPNGWTHSPINTRYLTGLSMSLIKIGNIDTLSEYFLSILTWDGRKETMTENVLATYFGVFDPHNEEDKDIPVYYK